MSTVKKISGIVSLTIAMILIAAIDSFVSIGSLLIAAAAAFALGAYGMGVVTEAYPEDID